MRAKEPFLIAALLGAGTAGFFAAWMIYQERSKQLVERPEASGDVGSITVFAQRPEGPYRIGPGRLHPMRRPQDLSFQWTVNGTGPRELRIEIFAEGKTTVMHEERLSAPAEQEPLQYVLHIGDRMPDQIELVVVLEAPHSVGYESRYPIVVTGSDKFTLPGTSTVTNR